MITHTHTLRISGIGQVHLTVTERGSGRPFLLLHGGGGPQAMDGFADLLSTREHAEVIVPTHPGFGGTPRPDTLTSIAGLAAVFAEFLGYRDLRDVTVIGSSIGGWIAAELALRADTRLSGLVLIDAVGIEVDGHPVTDMAATGPDELARRSYHDPAAFQIDPTTLTESQIAGIAANRAALFLYSGREMTDPTLRERLSRIALPTLVLWGESDRIADPVYGRAYADAIPGAKFFVIPAAGHAPQLENPEPLLKAIVDFTARN